MKGILGTGTYEVMIVDRITERPVPTTQLLRVNWSRRRDTPGNATAQFSSGDCAGFNFIRSWRHELRVYRDPGGLMFCGPITGIEDTKGTFSVSAADRSIWLDYRFPRGSETITADYSTLFKIVLGKALQDYDPIPMKSRILDTGKTGTLSWDFAERKTASQILQDTLDSSIDYTMIGDIIYAGERTIEAGSRAMLSEADLSADITGTETGKDLATIVHARGAKGLAVSYPLQTDDNSPIGDEYYGIVEQTVDFADIDNLEDLIVAARGWWSTRRHAPFRPRIPTGSQLSPNAPIPVEWLIPGAQVTLSMADIHCRQTTGLFELDTIDVSAGAGGGGTPRSASGQFQSVAAAAVEQIQVGMVAAIR